MKVWDLLTRGLHWTLAVSASTAWLSVQHLGIARAHEPAGYVALAVVLTRVVWGLVGTPYARFAQFVRGPGATLHYAAQLAKHQEPRHIGHNPLGGWMVLALLACVGGLGISGWLQTTDMFWGSGPLEWVHESLAWGLVTLVALHVIGVLLTSWRHRENLVLAMITGRKSPPQGDDVV